MQAHRKALLLIQPERVSHDQRRGAVDRDEANLQVGLFQRSAFIGHHLQGRQRQHAGDRGHCRADTNRLEKAPARHVVGKECAHRRGLDEVLRQHFPVARACQSRLFRSAIMRFGAFVLSAGTTGQRGMLRIGAEEVIVAHVCTLQFGLQSRGVGAANPQR